MKTYRIRPLPLISFENDMSVFTYRFNYGKRFEMPVYCCPSSTVIGIFGLHQSAKLLILDKADLLNPEKA